MTDEVTNDTAAAEASPADTGEAPQGIPEGGIAKFWNEAEQTYNWQAHAADAEWRLAQSKRDREALAEREDDDGPLYADDESESEDGEAESIAAPRIDMAKYTAEYEQYGDLSEASYAELEAVGIPPEMVDSYIANQEAAADRIRGEVFEVVGGEAEYMQMISWAADELPEADVESFNALANSGDLGAFKLAVKGLHEDYLEAVGRPATRRVSGTAAGDGRAPYSDWSAVTRAMRDPRYQTDASYRAEVEARLAISDLAGVRVERENIYRG